MDLYKNRASASIDWKKINLGRDFRKNWKKYGREKTWNEFV